MLFSDNFYWLRIEISGFRFQAYVPFFSVTQKFWIFSNWNEHINPSSTSVPSCNTQESKELRLQSVTCLSFASLELVQKWRIYDTKTVRTAQSKHVTKTATHTHQPRPATVVLVNSSSAAREQVTQQWVLVSSCPAGQRGAAVVIISVFHSTWLIVRYKTKIFFNFELHGLKNERVSKRDGFYG